MKKKWMFITSCLCLSLCIFSDTRIQPLESRLPGASGKEKIGILMELTDLYLVRNPEEALRLGEDALKLFEAFPNPEQEVILLNKLSIAGTNLGKFESGKNYALRARSIAANIKYDKGEAEALLNLAAVYISRGDYVFAKDNCMIALRLYKLNGDRRGLASVYRTMGVIYWRLSDFPRSLDYTYKAVGIYENLGDRNGLALTKKDIANINASLGEMKKSLEYRLEALKEFTELDDKIEIASMLNNIGNSYKDFGKHAEAIGYLNKALELSREIGFIRLYSYALNNIGEVYIKTKNYRRAQDYFEKSLRIKEEIGDQMGIAFTLINVGNAHRLDGQYKKAIPPLQRALTISTEIDVKSMVRDANLFLAESLEALGDYPAALRFHKKFREVNDSMYNEQNSKTLAELRTRYETETKEKEISLLKKNKQIQQLDLAKQRTLNNSLFIITILVVILAFVAYARYRLKARVTEILTKEISDRKKAEAELLRSRKLEAVGILAGGIAHDFNNLLSVIIGNLSLAIDDVEDRDPRLLRMLQAAERASQQAAELAQKLITFSAGGWILPQKVLLPAIIKRTLLHYPALHRYFENTSIPPDLRAIYGDDRQLRQVFRSILQNAGEAMNNSGQMRVEAENITFTGENEYALKEGDYVKISFIDNGRGIPPEHLDKIFDPYFSTKDTVTQKGMGLGLAICYSIIRRHNGHITVRSEVGKGTTVELYLPSAA